MARPFASPIASQQANGRAFSLKDTVHQPTQAFSLGYAICRAVGPCDTKSGHLSSGNSRKNPMPLRTNNKNKTSHLLAFAFFGCIAACFMLIPAQFNTSSAAAQTIDSGANNTDSIPRSVPAPWRPAFGSINNQNPASPDGDATPTTPVAQKNAAGTEPQQPATANRTAPLGANLPVADDGPGVTTVTQRLDKLPNSAGQVWREYDITPYTSRINNSENPQQAIIDWVLKETGTEMWFNQPLGVLSATPNQLYVYHTPEIQNVVRGIVDRFVRTRGQLQKLDVTLMTVENPNWRSQSYPMLQSINVRSPGVEAFMISKENAAILQGQLARRSDAKPVSSGTLTNHDGQEFLLKKTRPVQFVRSLKWVPGQIPNYQPEMTNVEEGYTLSISALSPLDNNSIEAIVKCNVDQVEKLQSIKVNVPGLGGNAQTMNLQIPQIVSWRLHERFRWPNDQVLLLSCGVVATPELNTGNNLPVLGRITAPKRADALLFLEYRGPATEGTVPRTAGSNLAPIRRN